MFWGDEGGFLFRCLSTKTWVGFFLVDGKETLVVASLSIYLRNELQRKGHHDFHFTRQTPWSALELRAGFLLPALVVLDLAVFGTILGDRHQGQM